MKYIEFLPFLPLQNTFEYKTTLDIEIGDVIRCRFGRFDTLGIVLSVHTTKQTHHELTSVSEIIFKNLLQSKQIELIKALEKYYGYSGGLFAKLFFPFSIKNSQFPYHTEMVKLSEEAKIDSSKSAKWKIIYNTLKNGNSVESSAFTGLTPFKKKNLLHFYFQKNHHKNFQESAIINTILPELSPEQNTVFSEIIKNTTSFKVHLIHGKTGSGKTEVYAHLVQRVVDVGAVSEPRVCRHISQGEIEGMPECEPLEEGETPQKSPPQAQAGESGDALHTSKLHDGKTQACVMDNAKTMASHEAQHNATVKVGSEDISRQNSTPPQAPALDRCSPSPPRSARSELSGLRAPPPSFNSTSPQILILLPEIGLAKVIAERLAKRFNCIIPIWHSSTPENKRKEYFRLIQDGACNVVVGTRSALFLPFKNLRMIIIDEEHDGSYKQEEAPIYNARDTAVLYGKLLNIPVILGSATPSVESYFNIQNGKYYLHELNARYTNIQMPEIQIINEKSKTFLSPTLQTKIIENYIAGKQTLIFINRRGFAPVNRCKCCNGIFKCEACDSLLTYHKKKSILTCHKCNFTIPLHSTCTMCGEDINIHSSGAGVEAVHEEVVKLVKGCYEQNKIIAVSEPRSEADVSHLKQQYFANKVCRHISQGEIEGMPECEPLEEGETPQKSPPQTQAGESGDAPKSPAPKHSDGSLPNPNTIDALASMGIWSPSAVYGAPPPTFNLSSISIFSSDEQNTEKKLSNFIENVQNGTVKIIIGTQIASKGYDFPNLKLVCIIDLILKNDEIDFKSDEKLMQIFTQVAGRGGRSGERGLVLIQSKRKKEEIERILHNNQTPFYTQEIQTRKENFLPPFSRFISVTVFGKSEKHAAFEASKIADDIRQVVQCNMFGPAPAPITFIKNVYRYKILLITHRSQVEIPKKLAEILQKHNAKIDVDAINFY